MGDPGRKWWYRGKERASARVLLGRKTRGLELAWQPGHRSARARVLALMYALGGLVCLTVIFRPAVPSGRVAAWSALGLAGILTALALYLRQRRLSWTTLQIMTTAYSVLIGVVAAGSLSPVGVVGLGPALTALVLTTAYFGTQRELALQLPVAAGCFVLGAALSRASSTGAGVFTTLVVSVAVGVVMSRLTGQLRRAGAFDPLTGVLNRATWLLMAGRQITRIDGRPSSAMSVALLDLDHFKAVNDVQGHLAGDQLLQSLTAAWQTELGEIGVLGRFGGDEFVVLYSGADPTVVANSLDRLAAAHPAAWSVGVGHARPGESVSEVLARADADLLRVKRSRPPVLRNRDSLERGPHQGLGGVIPSQERRVRTLPGR